MAKENTNEMPYGRPRTKRTCHLPPGLKIALARPARMAFCKTCNVPVHIGSHPAAHLGKAVES